MKIENVQQIKFVKTRVSVCNRIFKKLAEGNGIYIQKIQTKTSINRQTKENNIREKQSYNVNNWKKVIFCDESRISIGQGNDIGTFVWCYLNET